MHPHAGEHGHREVEEDQDPRRDPEERHSRNQVEGQPVEGEVIAESQQQSAQPEGSMDRRWRFAMTGNRGWVPPPSSQDPVPIVGSQRRTTPRLSQW